MKRISVYILFAFFAWTSIALFDHYFNKAEWLGFYRKTFAHQVDLLSSEGLVAQSFWQARGNYEELKGFLESRRRLDSISFWAINGPAGLMQGGLAGLTADQVGFDFEHPRDSIQRKGNIYYETEDLSADTHLVMGLIYDEDEFFKHQTEMLRISIIEYLVGVSALVLAIFAFFFRDITQSIRLMATQGPKAFIGKFRSRESELLARGLNAYDKSNRVLEKDAEVLKAQVLPSLRTELHSGRQPPYEFSCTIVRCDINNFTKIYNNFPVEPFAEIINEFFTEASHVVARYKGLVHEFIGDEIIFYFKDDEVENSVTSALSAIRDLNLVASEIHAQTLAERGYPFTVKSTLARTRLRYGKFVNAFALAGPGLIETVRILSHVAEKDGNIVVFDDRHRAEAESIGRCEDYASVRLKGFNDEHRLIVYRGHLEIEKVLASDSADKINILKCYRGDRDLEVILQWSRANAGTKTVFGSESAVAIEVSRVIGALRDIPVTKAGGNLQRILLDWIQTLLTKIQSAKVGEAEPIDLRLLASLLRLTENLVPKSEMADQFVEVLRSALEVRDRRVVANAIESLTTFRRDQEPEVTARLARHPDNRVAANALLQEGLRQMSPFVVKRLQKMLSSRNVFNIASGLYALGEISAFHRVQDPVYYGTQIEFLKLVNWIPAFAAHEDAMVRRQALIAARKCGDDHVIESIYHALDERGPAGRKTEIEAHLGPRKVQSKAG